MSHTLADDIVSAQHVSLLQLDRAAVLDLGASCMKVGFAGERCPRHVVPTPIPLHFLAPMAAGSQYCAPLGSTPPTLSETIDAFEKLLRRMFFTLLQVNPKETPVFVAESLFTCDTARSALAHALFTRIGVPALTMIPQSVCASLACGGTIGLVMDVGLLEATCIPVVDGYPLFYAMRSTRRAGAAIEVEIDALHEESRLDRKTLEDIKTRLCFVKDSKEDARVVADITYKINPSQSTQVSGIVRSGAAEILFDSSLERCMEEATLQELVLDTLLQSPRETRAALAANLVLCGGSVMLPGFQRRLSVEVMALLESDNRFVELRGLVRSATPVVMCAEPVFPCNTLPWVGAALLGAIKGLTLGKVTKEQYMTQAATNTRNPLRVLLPCWNHIQKDSIDAQAATKDETEIKAREFKWRNRSNSSARLPTANATAM